jgi:antitoxin component YwqK of YwqJK toxin-antitoxin module
VKYLLLLAGIAWQLSALAQKTETFYDYNWKPCTVEKARFYSTLEKTDSGWFRHDYFINSRKLQMQALYKDSTCKIQNGYCIYFHANGNVSTIGRRVNNKNDDVCVQYYSNGMMADSATYKDGMSVGCRITWHRNGYMSDSIRHVNDSMDIHIGWFDDGSLSFSGYWLRGNKHGKWKYYHRNGNLAGNEIFDRGKVIRKDFFGEDNTPQPDTSKANSEASFKKGGIEGWRKYLADNSYWPAGLQLANTNAVTIGVEFTINEEGKPEEIEAYIPFHNAFDKIAIGIIRKSPAWKPAMQHNRKVKQRFRQPVTFQQEE